MTSPAHPASATSRRLDALFSDLTQEVWDFSQPDDEVPDAERREVLMRIYREARMIALSAVGEAAMIEEVS